MIKPYYQDKHITIYHGDCLEIMPHLEPVDLVFTDPPYGINHPTDYRSRGRGKWGICNNYPPIYGDNKEFDPQWLLALEIPLVLFGANYFANKLPPSAGWIVWDKKRPDTLDQATCELAWTNWVKGVRRFSHLWNGSARDSEFKQFYHPTQKPIALWKWILSLKWSPPGVIVDPYMGAGGTLIAAKELGRKAIGIDIEEKYCEITADRLRQGVFDFADNSQPR